MQRLFAANEGFRRRVGKCFHFQDLTSTDIAQVMHLKMRRKGQACSSSSSSSNSSGSSTPKSTASGSYSLTSSSSSSNLEEEGGTAQSHSHSQLLGFRCEKALAKSECC